MKTLTSVGIQETVEIGGRVFEFYEAVLYRENFKYNLFEKVIVNLVALRQKYKDENNVVTQLLVKLYMNALYGEIVRKEILETY